MQNFKIVVDKDDKCKLQGQTKISRNFNINNTTEGHKNKKLTLSMLNQCILAIYRSPLCNFDTFLNNFDLNLHNFLKSQIEFYYMWGH